MENKFEKLAAKDVSAHVEKKDTGRETLSYLSWTWAWDAFKREYPDAVYSVREWDGGKPYLFDENTGYMVGTTITAGGETHGMWLPVMDGSNRAMTNKAYQVKTKFKTIDVAAATMFDINKAIMRCLVKNMAMFGLGLYIYAGEDLPFSSEEKPDVETKDGVFKIKYQKEETVLKEPEGGWVKHMTSDHVVRINCCQNLIVLEQCMNTIKKEMGPFFEKFRKNFEDHFKRRKSEIMTTTGGLGL